MNIQSVAANIIRSEGVFDILAGHDILSLSSNSTDVIGATVSVNTGDSLSLSSPSLATVLKAEDTASIFSNNGIQLSSSSQLRLSSNSKLIFSSSDIHLSAGLDTKLIALGDVTFAASNVMLSSFAGDTSLHGQSVHIDSSGDILGFQAANDVAIAATGNTANVVFHTNNLANFAASETMSVFAHNMTADAQDINFTSAREISLSAGDVVLISDGHLSQSANALTFNSSSGAHIVATDQVIMHAIDQTTISGQHATIIAGSVLAINGASHVEIKPEQKVNISSVEAVTLNSYGTLNINSIDSYVVASGAIMSSAAHNSRVSLGHDADFISQENMNIIASGNGSSGSGNISLMATAAVAATSVTGSTSVVANQGNVALTAASVEFTSSNLLKMQSIDENVLIAWIRLL